ncbi:hypothetical protein FF36_06243 [Frankia torreyi]|uniref:Uncharacterized protein n=1 Tax=Frankia torreyi TaxID=1856 RepID=A0A0D8B5L5_9ACTN|nr:MULTISPECIES: hypothetical protein [Frankia]KJE19471.1 hypothetical protein FF36_06243 [Frankia torreyi]KQM04950.1 hypothetical protein FF86_10205 [Frankia sp. CpI1-P]
MSSQSQEGFGPVQLARWLGMKEWQLRRAQNLGLIPPPDLHAHRWSHALARTLPDRVEQILAEVGERPEPTADGKTSRPRSREGFGPVQLARSLGIQEWQLRHAQFRGLVPPPDIEGRRWSDALAETLPDRVEQILAEVGDHPGIGSEKSAQYLAERTALDVQRADVQALHERGILRPTGEFRGWPLYAVKELDALAPDQLLAVVADRQRWLAASLTNAEAAELLGWSVGRFEVTAERGGLAPGRFGRYARADVEGLRHDR